MERHAAWWVAGIAAMTVSCENAQTLLRVRVDSDLRPSTEITSIHVDARWEGSNERVPGFRGSVDGGVYSLERFGLPGYVDVAVGDDVSRRVSIRIAAETVHGRIEQRALVRLVAHQSREIRFFLSRACIPLRCADRGPGLTCGLSPEGLVSCIPEDRMSGDPLAPDAPRLDAQRPDLPTEDGSGHIDVDPTETRDATLDSTPQDTPTLDTGVDAVPQADAAPDVPAADLPRHDAAVEDASSGDLGVTDASTDVGPAMPDAFSTDIPAPTDLPVTTDASPGDGSLEDVVLTDAPVRDATVDAATCVATVDGGVHRFVQVATSWDHTCAVTCSGEVWCWGLNNVGQLGDGTLTDSPRAVHVRLDGPAAQVAVGGAGPSRMNPGPESHSCARMQDGTVRCWGGNQHGALGDGLMMGSLTPVIVRTAAGPLTGALDLAAGLGWNCVLTTGGALCWGYNFSGELGIGRGTLSRIAVRANVAGVTGIAAGGFIGCATTASDAGTGVTCWGNRTSSYDPEPILGGSPPLTNVVQVVTGGSINQSQTNTLICFRLSSGQLRCLGGNVNGEVGDNTRLPRTEPVAVVGIDQVAQVVAGADFACARQRSGQVWCWGSGVSGQIAQGVGSSIPRATELVGVNNAVHLAAGGRTACAILDTGATLCWGLNDVGQLGDGTTAGNGPSIVVGP